MPLPSTRVVHPQWSAHHQPVSEGTMNAQVSITFGSTGGGEWNPDLPPDQQGDGVPVVTYSGRARLTYDARDRDASDAAGQEITSRAITAALPRDALEQSSGARLRVDAVDANGPMALAGREFTVLSTAFPSHAVEQVLLLADDQSNQELP